MIRLLLHFLLWKKGRRSLDKTNEAIIAYTVHEHIDRKTQRVTREFWISQESGKPSRIGGPSEIVFDPVTGNKLEETYLLDGMLHRPAEEGPAHQEWHPETGKLIVEAYFEYDKRHRPDDKPALILYDHFTGKVTMRRYCKRGHKYNPTAKRNNHLSPK